MPGPYAKLIVNIKGGHNLRDTAWVGKNDPYAVVKVAGAEVQTHHIHNGGENVTWDETFAFNNVALDDILEISVYDHSRLRKDELIGSGTLPVREAFEEGQLETRVPLGLAGYKSSGEVWLSIKMEDLSTAVHAQSAGIDTDMPPIQVPSAEKKETSSSSPSSGTSPSSSSKAGAEAPIPSPEEPAPTPEEVTGQTAALQLEGTKPAAEDGTPEVVEGTQEVTERPT